ncbi:CoA transferase [Marmoricola endophyticus]|uniref:CoA transferase n=1 Tax=Marmoricola endophyticus TaxID=2040280 RepID=A0A917BEJ7_9ACTN|nr:CoA transferase [Marmoricola endophyticus]GGF40316.1 CoA transferase [Marmoricola endophyticus]
MTRLSVDTTESSFGPLAGVKVVELASVVMAPYAAELLGDLGAEVVKVEPPTGELARQYPGGRTPGMGPLFMNSNMNKRSVVCDLKSDGGRQDFFDLLAEADIFVTNQRPQALTKLGISYDQIGERFPALVYCSAQGFRRGSAQYEQAAYDEIVQSAAGLTSAMDYLTGNPSCVPSIIADKLSSLAILGSALAALHSRTVTGRGQEVNVPMVDTIFAFTMVEHLAGNTFAPPTGDGGYSIAFNVEHGDVRASDGTIAIHPYSLQNMRDLLAAAGQEERMDTDPYFADWANTATDGRKHVYEVVREVAPSLSVEEWATVCQKHSIPMALPVDIMDPLSNDYVREGDLLPEVSHSTEGDIRVRRYPVQFSGTPLTTYHEAPRLGGAVRH